MRATPPSDAGALPGGGRAGPSAPLALEREIRRFGTSVRSFFTGGRPPTLTSPLFNVPARLVVGSYCYFEHLPWILREVTAAVPAGELASAMKHVATRPNYVSLSSLMLGYLNGREQLRLRAGLADDEVLGRERRADDELVVGFWREVGARYVDAPSFLPDENGYRLPILAPGEVDELLVLVGDGGPGAGVPVRRAMAVTELYTFILNGEARVGVFHHGPYPLPGGDVLVVKELVGLRDRSLPWAPRELPPVGSLCRAMRLRGVEVRIDLFGSLVTAPSDYAAHVVGEAYVTNDGGSLRPVTPQEIAETERRAADAQVAMYEEAIGWSPYDQIAYGADLYASLALGFARAAGLDLGRQVVDAFHETAVRVVPDLLSGADPLLVLGRLAAPDGEVYSQAVPPARGGDPGARRR